MGDGEDHHKLRVKQCVLNGVEAEQVERRLAVVGPVPIGHLRMLHDVLQPVVDDVPVRLRQGRDDESDCVNPAVDVLIRDDDVAFDGNVDDAISDDFRHGWKAEELHAGHVQRMGRRVGEFVEAPVDVWENIFSFNCCEKEEFWKIKI